MPGFDHIVMSKLNRLEDAGGYAEKSTLSADKNSEKMDIFGDGNLYVKVSDKKIDLRMVTSIALTYETVPHTVKPDYLGFFDEAGNQMIYLDDQLNIFVISMQGDEESGLAEGVYFRANDDTYVSQIALETIVPIDQKYLPGVCLPVVELTGCALGEAITDETVITALNKCYAESPVIIGSIMTEGVTYLVFNKFVGMGFVASLMGGSISLVVSDGNWTLSFE